MTVLPNRLVEAIGEACGQALLIGLDRASSGLPALTVHRIHDPEIPDQRPALKRACRGLGLAARTRQRSHRPGRLEKASSLEELIRHFRHQEIVADPTGFHGRTSALVAFAHAMRARMDDKVCGLYWNSDWRALYVVLRAGRFVRKDKVRAAELAAAEDTAHDALSETCGHLAPHFQPCLRLGFELPETPVTPVDIETHGFTAGRAGALAWLRRAAPIPAMGALFGFGLAGVAAADGSVGSAGQPAVSGPNGKIGFSGGFEDQDNVSGATTGRLLGSYTLPLGQRFGLQIDGMLGVNDDDFTGGAGGHLFWRDPSRALFGITAAYAEVDRSRTNGFDKDIAQIGGEAELYLGDLTLSGGAGGQSGSRIDDGLFARGDLHWYVSDNFMLSAGAQYDDEREGLARFGLEYMPAWGSMHGMTLFADGRFGDEDYTHVRAGLRLYFGKSRTLKERHRYDDPVTNTADYAADSLTGDPEAVPPPPIINTPM